MKLYVGGVFALLLAALVVILGGTHFYPAEKLALVETPVLSQDLDHYLADSEAKIHPKLGTEKMILWNSPQKKKTRYALVYIHGFSATRREISPVTEDLAKKLHANAFFTRLEGHGLTTEDFGRAQVSSWVREANEALAVGKTLGDKVILVGTSTGATLALHLAAKKDPAIAALILLSANLRPYRPESLLSSGPLGTWITELVLGKRGFTWQTHNAEQAYYWTPTFLPSTIHQLMELVKYVDSLPLNEITTPSLWIYTHNDTAIDTVRLQAKFQEMAGQPKNLVDTGARDHVLAGTIVSPEETEKVEKLILEFIQGLGPGPLF